MFPVQYNNCNLLSELLNDSLFDNFFYPTKRNSSWPVEYDDKTGVYSTMLELPGFTKDNLEIKIEGNNLIVKGTLLDDKIKNVVSKSSVYQSVYIKDIDPESIDAELLNGILYLKFKTTENKNIHTISIK